MQRPNVPSSVSGEDLPRTLQQRLDRNKSLKLVYSYDDAQICVKKGSDVCNKIATIAVSKQQRTVRHWLYWQCLHRT